MAYQKPLLVDEKQAAQQAGLFALAAQTIAPQALPDQPEMQQYRIARAMPAWRCVQDRYQEILGIRLAIEVLYLQHKHGLQTIPGDETLGKPLLKPTCLARDAVDYVRGRDTVDALQALSGAVLSVSVNAALAGGEGVRD